MKGIVRSLEALVRERLIAWPPAWEGYHWPGYTYEHTMRVRGLALALAERERADADIVHLAALLHDIRKDAGETHAAAGAEEARGILTAHGVAAELRERVCDAIAAHAGGNTPQSPIENLCLGDADLIDANFGLVAIWRFVTIRAGSDYAWPDTIRAMQQWLPKKRALLDLLLTGSGREVAQQRAARMDAMCNELLKQAADNVAEPPTALLDVWERIHSDRGRHLLAEQLAAIEQRAADEGADAVANVVCRSMRAEMTGVH